MSKKSILTLIFTLILSFSLQGVVFAEKETESKNTTTKTEKVDDKKEKNKEKEKDEDAFPDLNTDYYLLAELDTGKVLEVKNGDKKARDEFIAENKTVEQFRLRLTELEIE